MKNLLRRRHLVYRFCAAPVNRFFVEISPSPEYEIAPQVRGDGLGDLVELKSYAIHTSQIVVEHLENLKSKMRERGLSDQEIADRLMSEAVELIFFADEGMKGHDLREKILAMATEAVSSVVCQIGIDEDPS